MHLAHSYDLIKVIPLNRSCSDVTSFLRTRAKRPKSGVHKNLYRFISTAFGWCDGLLRSILPRSKSETISSIQDHDPYLESLLITLRGR